jgi:hypothetical protein
MVGRMRRAAINVYLRDCLKEALCTIDIAVVLGISQSSLGVLVSTFEQYTVLLCAIIYGFDIAMLGSRVE